MNRQEYDEQCTSMRTLINDCHAELKRLTKLYIQKNYGYEVGQILMIVPSKGASINVCLTGLKLDENYEPILSLRHLVGCSNCPSLKKYFLKKSDKVHITGNYFYGHTKRKEQDFQKTHLV